MLRNLAFISRKQKGHAHGKNGKYFRDVVKLPSWQKWKIAQLGNAHGPHNLLRQITLTWGYMPVDVVGVVEDVIPDGKGVDKHRYHGIVCVYV